jgi:hypothetical protein
MIIICIIGGLISCNDSTTDSNPPFKHPKEMTWSADTLPVPEYAIQVLPEDLTVIAPDNIWLATWVGHAQFMHFDGDKWSLAHEIAGGIFSLTYDNYNRLWAGGYSNNIYIGYFDGFNWNRVDDMGVTGAILDMTTDEEGNIWACGRNGVVLKYSQSSDQWFLDTVIVGYHKSHPETEYFLRSIQSFNKKRYLIAWVIDFNRVKNIYYFIEGKLNNWEVVDSIVSEGRSNSITFGNRGIFHLDNNKLYTYGSLGLWYRINSEWIKLYDSSSSIYDVSGADAKYLLAVGPFKSITYYNGSYWEDLANLFSISDPEFVFNNVWTNGYQTVIAGYGNVDGITKTIVWRGR